MTNASFQTAIDQFLPRDDVTGAVKEELQDAEHARRQRDFPAVAAEEARMGVERERAKREAGKALTVGDERRGRGGGHGKTRMLSRP